MAKERRRFNTQEIGLLRYLARIPNFVGLSKRARAIAVPLWRRGIVHCLYLQVADCGRALRGPYFRLTTLGHQLALMFLRADGELRKKTSPSSSSPARATARA